MIAEPALLKYLSVRAMGDGLQVTYRLPDAVRDVHPKAGKSAERLFRKTLSRLGTHSAEQDGGTAFYVSENNAGIHLSLISIDARMAAILDAPLSGSHVEQALAISGLERRRWARDGRLSAHSKSVSGRSDHLFSLALYDVGLIGSLAADLTQTRQWRADDAEHIAPGSGSLPSPTLKD